MAFCTEYVISFLGFQIVFKLSHLPSTLFRASIYFSDNLTDSANEVVSLNRTNRNVPLCQKSQSHLGRAPTLRELIKRKQNPTRNHSALLERYGCLLLWRMRNTWSLNCPVSTFARKCFENGPRRYNVASISSFATRRGELKIELEIV